jgi:hypothetical protein
MEMMIKILLIVWQLPQTIIGIVLLAWYRADRLYGGKVAGYKDTFWNKPFDYVTNKIHGAISLGELRIYGLQDYNKGVDSDIYRHEYGHTLQSRILGPLYLIVIGIPSLLWAAWWRSAKVKPGYYTFFTEVWADKLGGIRRIV